MLLLAFLSVSAMAATTTINKNDAEVQDYGGPMNEYVLTYGDTNLKLNSKISFGGDVMVTLRWEGKSAGSYTLTGNGSMPYRTVWNLDSGTYEFKVNPGN